MDGRTPAPHKKPWFPVIPRKKYQRTMVSSSFKVMRTDFVYPQQGLRKASGRPFPPSSGPVSCKHPTILRRLHSSPELAPLFFFLFLFSTNQAKEMFLFFLFVYMYIYIYVCWGQLIPAQWGHLSFLSLPPPSAPGSGNGFVTHAEFCDALGRQATGDRSDWRDRRL